MAKKRDFPAKNAKRREKNYYEKEDFEFCFTIFNVRRWLFAGFG